MPQYIDREKIKLNSLTWTDGEGDILVPLVEVKKAIAQVPAEDVVKVVRCKDCKYWYNSCYDPILSQKYGCCLSTQWDSPDENFETAENNFCSFGERKENESSID